MAGNVWYWFHVSLLLSISKEDLKQGVSEYIAVRGWDVISSIRIGDELMEFGLGYVADQLGLIDSD